ncbi:UTP--glucose-1-phosphate uridylyltransferase [Planctomycetota bacterium]
MDTQKNFENVTKLLKKHDQGHLLAFWQQLDQHQKNDLLAQIDQLDFSQIPTWINQYVKNPSPAAIPTDFAPAPSYSPTPQTPELQKKYDQAVKMGKNLISKGKIAAFVVAGGQGTRLGFNGPKGNLPISPIKNKTLFQIFAENIAAAAKKYNSACPWYIMTSPLNHDQTMAIFSDNDYFGLNKKDVFIFPQGTMPNFDFNGNILLAGAADIARSPDGHGGSLKALYKSGAIDDMKKHGVEYISYFQVDNPLINIFDPLFIGLHAQGNAQMSSKALPKTDPLEKVGNFCLVDGKVAVIEYSDLPDAQAKRRNPDKSLMFGLGSIAIHIINTDFVAQLNAKGFSLPLHKAIKKIPYIDENANPVTPDKPNGVKLETFVFDALSFAENSIILQTIREQEFAPTKNATGPDSAQTAKQMMIDRAANWLESAGITVPKKTDGSVDCTIEIAPDFALEKEDIIDKADQIPQINPGDKIYLG